MYMMLVIYQTCTHQLKLNPQQVLAPGLSLWQQPISISADSSDTSVVLQGAMKVCSISVKHHSQPAIHQYNGKRQTSQLLLIVIGWFKKHNWSILDLPAGVSSLAWTSKLLCDDSIALLTASCHSLLATLSCTWLHFLIFKQLKCKCSTPSSY